MTAVAKKTIPHASEARTDAHAFAINKHATEQIEAGHYSVKNVKVKQSRNPDGSQHLEGSFDRVETDPTVAAQPHGLDLS